MPSILDQEINYLVKHLKANEETKLTKFSHAAITHTGRVRVANEDAYMELSEQSLWLVADGMGGYSRGSCASKAIVKSFKSFVKQDSLSANLADIETRLNAAHKTCRELSKGKRIGSTVVVLFIQHGYCFFIWSGDSRIYRLRNDRLKMMTCDHTVAQDKFSQGKMDLKEALYHASNHTLTQAIGVHRDLRLELRYDKIEAGDRYLLCTDGLYSNIYSRELRMQLSEGTPENALQSLLDDALDKGGTDNITGIAVDVDS
jgi:protein phosphatase